ncbi:uncharacterized protein LOC6614641 [Drosophila sechellia]|nr:uncharacterized protein LOC6614641 [Drosophila sechellia]
MLYRYKDIQIVYFLPKRKHPGKMRRRELQTIQLKLSDLKEYEQAKMERLRSRQQLLTPRTPTPPSDSEVLPATSSSVPAVLLASGKNLDNDADKSEPTTKPSTSST